MEHRTPHPATLAKFAPDTLFPEAAVLMAAAFQSIAQGWPIVYMRQPALAGSAAVMAALIVELAATAEAVTGARTEAAAPPSCPGEAIRGRNPEPAR